MPVLMIILQFMVNKDNLFSASSLNQENHQHQKDLAEGELNVEWKKKAMFNIAEAQSTPVEDLVGVIPSNLVTNRASDQQKLSATLGRILKIPKSILSGEFYIEIFLYMNF